MLQKGIELIALNGRPIDFRLMLLKPAGRWEVMGIMGKLAARHLAVTNYNHGGQPITFESALRRAGYEPQVR